MKSKEELKIDVRNIAPTLLIWYDHATDPLEVRYGYGTNTY